MRNQCNGSGGLTCCLVICAFIFLTACGRQEPGEGQQGSAVENTEGTTDYAENTDIAAGTENRSELQRDNSCEDILAVCNGMTIVQTMETSAGNAIVIDAQISVDDISRVSRYRYIPQQFTEEGRKILLEKTFPAESWNVNEAAVYNAKADAWEFVTPRRESWIYQVDVSEIPKEQIMNLEKVDEELNYVKGREISSVRISDEVIEVEDELLMEITGCVPREIEQIGIDTIETIADIDTYSCNYIHICEDDEGHRYAKAVFKQVIDGMPVTVWHNFATATAEKSVFPVKVWGTSFATEEIGLDKPILTPIEAVAAIEEQIDFVRMQEMQLCVTKISLEYLSVISSEETLEIVPIWRFWLGNDELERSMMCEQIFAVNAVSGEVIWEERGAFTK